MSDGPDEARIESLNTEVELIESSLLPVESLISSSRDTLSRTLDISSVDSKLRLSVQAGDDYPRRRAIEIEVKGNDVGREEAEEWKSRVEGMMQDWDELSEAPLYTIMTTHFLPLLAKSEAAPSDFASAASPPPSAPTPHHALIITHHLLSPTKRKLLIQLSSELNLVGFSKTGHPGILYAIGEKEDIGEWLVHVKSWNWLALKVRITCERVPDDLSETAAADGNNADLGSREAQKSKEGKARGDWVELDRLADALEWMRVRGREKLLIDAGVGSSAQ